MAKKREKEVIEVIKEVVAAGPLRRFEVKLSGVPGAFIEAEDPLAAWDAFKALRAIISSDHKPEIVEVVDERVD